MNIFDTFELFLRKPISILKHGLVSIVHIKAENIDPKESKINVDLLENKAQITVINSKKTYQLLKMVMYRAKQKELQAKTNNTKLLEANK